MDIITYRIITYLLTVITFVIVRFYEITRSCDVSWRPATPNRAVGCPPTVPHLGRAGEKEISLKYKFLSSQYFHLKHYIPLLNWGNPTCHLAARQKMQKEFQSNFYLWMYEYTRTTLLLSSFHIMIEWKFNNCNQLQEVALPSKTAPAAGDSTLFQNCIRFRCKETALFSQNASTIKDSSPSANCTSCKR